MLSARNPYSTPVSTWTNVERLFRSHLTEISRATGIDRSELRRATPVGSGFNGIAFRLYGFPIDQRILKVTTDDGERVAARAIIRQPVGHAHLPKLALEADITKSLGVILKEDVPRLQSPRELGMDPTSFATALHALADLSTAIRSGSSVGKIARKFSAAARNSPVESLWNLSVDLFSIGILVRPADWRSSNLGLRHGSTVVLNDLGADVSEDLA